MKQPNQYPPIRIGCAPFTFRSLHGPDRRTERCENEEHTLDQIVTITLSAVGRKATREVVL